MLCGSCCVLCVVCCVQACFISSSLFYPPSSPGALRTELLWQSGVLKQQIATRVSPKVCLGARLGRRRRIWPGFSLASTVLFCGHSSLALLPVAVRCLLLLSVTGYCYLLLSAVLLSGAVYCRLLLTGAGWYCLLLSVALSCSLLVAVALCCPSGLLGQSRFSILTLQRGHPSKWSGPVTNSSTGVT